MRLLDACGETQHPHETLHSHDERNFLCVVGNTVTEHPDTIKSLKNEFSLGDILAASRRWSRSEACCQDGEANSKRHCESVGRLD